MVQEEHGILPLRLDSWFNCKVMELGLEQTISVLSTGTGTSCSVSNQC